MAVIEPSSDDLSERGLPPYDAWAWSQLRAEVDRLRASLEAAEANVREYADQVATLEAEAEAEQ